MGSVEIGVHLLVMAVGAERLDATPQRAKDSQRKTSGERGASALYQPPTHSQ